MKIKKKKVEVTQIVYIADDGTEFENKDDCEEYETRKLGEGLNCYNSDFNKVGFEECIYINLITEEDVETAKRLCDYYSVTDNGLDKPGVYRYIDEYCDSEQWLSLDDVIFYIRGGVGK